MRLGQLKWNNTVTAAIFENGQARPIPEYNLYDLILRSEKEHVELAALAGRLAAPHLQAAPPVIPLSPREIWACDRNYEGSSYVDGYRVSVDRVDRPEIFFKGTAVPGRPLAFVPIPVSRRRNRSWPWCWVAKAG